MTVSDLATLHRIALWLLVAVGADLLLTRFLVRLAIFIPKGEPFATIGALLGRVGAAVDVFVPIVGALLLGALLLRAGAAGDRLEQALLVAVAVVASLGLALIWYPPTPIVVVLLGALIGSIAAIAGGRIAVAHALPVIARLGLVLLAAAIAVAAAARTVNVVGPSGDAASPWPAELILGTAGQAAFIGGAGLVGLAGVAGDVANGRVRRRFAIMGLVTAAGVLAAGAAAPLTFGALAIWSLGLTGAIAPVAVAAAIGLSVAGLPSLHRTAPSAASGTAIVLLAGYDLAASGLVLASLLGLLLVASGGAGLSTSIVPQSDANGAS